MLRHARPLGLVAAAVVVLRLAAASPASAANGDLTLVSTSDAGVKANGFSTGVGLSADGTRIAFSSLATNLGEGDTDASMDVFVKDVTTGELALASSSDAGTKANGASSGAGLSDDGNRVVFASAATNLGEGDLDSTRDVYVKDLATDALTLASTSDTGGKGNLESVNASLSADGTIVAFDSSATNLGEGDTDSEFDVYVKDLTTGALRLVSTSDTGVKGSGMSWNPSISDDGTKVSFTSRASNLGEGDTNTNEDVYVKDLVTGQLTLASRSLTGGGGNWDSYWSALSGDGRVVAFNSQATDLAADDPDGNSDVYVRDLSTGSLTLASRSASGAKGNDWSAGARLSRDGSVVTFASEATNLSPGDTDTPYDAFVKDLSTGAVILASTSDTGTSADAAATPGAISADGTVVLMVSEATNLGEGDTDATFDVFVKELPGPAVPVATSDAYAATAGSTLTVSAPGVLGNDSDANDGDVLRARLVTGPTHGTVSLAADGGFTYVPAAGYVGSDSFSYRATDGSSSSTSATVGLTVVPPNRAPVADAGTDQEVANNAGFTLHGGGTDADGDPLTFGWTQVGGPAAVIREPSRAETSVDGVRGPATLVFRLTVTDPSGASSSDEVTISVRSK
jgi:Tol biopolymer transport system component